MVDAFYVMNSQNPEFSVIVVINNNISYEEVFGCLATFAPQEGDVFLSFWSLTKETKSVRKFFDRGFPG